MSYEGNNACFFYGTPSHPTLMDDDEADSPILDVSDIPESSNAHGLPKDWIFDKEHPRDQVIGDIFVGITL